MTTALTHFESARQSLQQASSIDEVKEVRDKAEALRQYAKQQGEGLEMQNQCAEIKIRAERRAGELLGGMDGMGSQGGDRRSSNTMGLERLGITRMQSHRWQTIASMPVDQFEQHIESTRARRAELTSIGIYRTAKQLRASQEISHQGARPADGSSGDLQDFIASGVKYGCVYADPAWRYGNQATRASTDNHYKTMTVDEICALPVAELAADNAHLHLWTTNAFLFDAKRVIEAWGFEYKSVLVWVKPQMGIGNYWRVSHEFLLLGTRGRAPFQDRSQMSWVRAERTRHSAKPERVRDMVQLVSPGPYIELFCRHKAPGWSAWGDQIEHGLYS